MRIAGIGSILPFAFWAALGAGRFLSNSALFEGDSFTDRSEPKVPSLEVAGEKLFESTGVIRLNLLD